MGGFICRISFSIVGVCQWHSCLWQTWISNPSHQCSAGIQAVVDFLTLLLGVMLNLISSMQNSETEGAICKSLCCYHPPNQGKKWFVCSLLLQVSHMKLYVIIGVFFWGMWIVLRTWICLALWKRYGMEFGKPTFVPVQDLEMGFEKIVKIAHSRGGKSLLFEVHLNGYSSKWFP